MKNNNDVWKTSENKDSSKCCKCEAEIIGTTYPVFDDNFCKKDNVIQCEMCAIFN